VGGNPLNHIDPTGLCPWNPTDCPIVKQVGGAIASGTVTAAGAVTSTAGATKNWVGDHLPNCVRNPLGGNNGNGGCETPLSTSQGTAAIGVTLGIGATIASGGA